MQDPSVTKITGVKTPPDERTAGTSQGVARVGLLETFVVTVKFDESSFERLAAMRRQYFPVAHDRVPAHLTLLHQLDLSQIGHLLAQRTRLLAWPEIGLQFRSLRLTGRGIAVDVQSSGLPSLRDAIVDIAGGGLIRQDQQHFRPHVTVQNKVPAAEAQAAHAQLSACFAPWSGSARAILIWRYLGGPWSLEHELPLANA